MSKLSKWLSNAYLFLVLRGLLGIMFITSAVTKFPHHEEFVGVVKGYDILPDFLATAYADSLPWVELIFGAYLVLAIMVRISAIVSLLMAISFMVANVTAISRGDEHCGSCFGELTILPVEQAIIMDCLIIIASLILIFFQPKKHLFSLESLVNRKRP